MSNFQVRVYYEDTDFSGYVYHANYLKYCERARSAYLREIGVDQNAMFAEGMTFVVCKIDCEFLRPAKFDDELVVETSIHRMSAARLELTQIVVGQQKSLFCAKVMVAIVNKDGRPVRMPQTLYAKFMR